MYFMASADGGNLVLPALGDGSANAENPARRCAVVIANRHVALPSGSVSSKAEMGHSTGTFIGVLLDLLPSDHRVRFVIISGQLTGSQLFDNAASGNGS